MLGDMLILFRHLLIKRKKDMKMIYALDKRKYISLKHAIDKRDYDRLTLRLCLTYKLKR